MILPYCILDNKFGNPLKELRNISDRNGVLYNMNQKNKNRHADIFEAFLKYKRYYDRKAKTSPLKVKYFTFVPTKKQRTPSDKIPFRELK